MHVAHCDTQNSTLHGSVLFQVADHLAGDADRYGKGIAGKVSGLGINRRIDAHQLAFRIDQCAAAVAGVHRCIRLDKRFDAAAAGYAATPFGTDDAGGDGGGKVKRIADCQHPFAHFELLGIAEGDGRQVLCLNLDQGNVGGRVCTDYLSRKLAVVVQRHFQLVRTVHHVVVGHNIAIGGNNHARTGTHAGLRLLRLLTAIAEPEEILKRVNVLLSSPALNLRIGNRLDMHYGMYRILSRHREINRFRRSHIICCQAERLLLKPVSGLHRPDRQRRKTLRLYSRQPFTRQPRIRPDSDTGTDRRNHCHTKHILPYFLHN
ncbi:hypothetical protein Barb7_02853 [Bacteroidales bacterium Barb7]|nr:hypothetical protein Barb7_02853 [Bacteroidales bacterium Barb7]